MFSLYKLSTDYVELFNLIKSEHRVAAYYERVISNNKTSLDLIEVKMTGGVITAGVRGLCVIHIDELSLQLAQQNTPCSASISLLDLFISDCRDSKLQWIIP